MNKINNYLYYYGFNSVYHALSNNNREVHTLFYIKERIKKNQHIITLAKSRKCRLVECDKREIEKYVAFNCKHQGIVLQLRPLSSHTLNQFFKHNTGIKKIALLDKITDPHNIGAIYRSAAAFDIDVIIVTKNNFPQESALLANIACGGYDIAPTIQVNNLTSAILELKKRDFWIIGLDAKTNKSINSINEFEKIGIVLGAEGKGLSKLVRDNVDISMHIPMSQNIDSINVSNAAAIVFQYMYTESEKL